MTQHHEISCGFLGQIARYPSQTTTRGLSSKVSEMVAITLIYDSTDQVI